LFGQPGEVVDATKLRRIEKCAWCYLRQTKREDASWSIKVIEVFQGHCTLIDTLL
jgi:Holliday junction resolvase-like predicted endonuclease